MYRPVVHPLQLLRDRVSSIPDLPAVHLPYRVDSYRRPAEEEFVGSKELLPREVVPVEGNLQVSRELYDCVPRNPPQDPRTGGRRAQYAVLDSEDVFTGPLSHQPDRIQHYRFVVPRRDGLPLFEGGGSVVCGALCPRRGGNE